jgi:CHAT domain-containing protein/tetratricopeptide (TPR) repeat protein
MILASGSRAVVLISSVAAALLVSCQGSFAETTNELTLLQARCKELVAGQFKLVEARPVVDKLLALTLEQRDELHRDTVIALHWVAFLAQHSGRYAEAEQTWQRSLAIQEKSPTKDVVWFSRTLHMLAGVAQEQFDFPRAEDFLKRALESREGSLGPDHPETANVVRTLGGLAKKTGNFARAESLLLRALASFERAGRHYESAVTETLSSLAFLYLDLGDLDKAEPLLIRALKMNEEQLGPEHSRTINSLNGLGNVRLHRGDLAGAAELYERGLRLREELNGPDDLTLCWPLHQLASVHLRSNRFTEAETLLQRMLAVVCKRLGPAHPSSTSALDTLAQIHERRGDYLLARDCLSQALQISERHLGSDHYSTAVFRRSLARVQYALGHPEMALAAAAQIQDGEEKRRADVLSFTSERQRLVYNTEWGASDGYALWATMGAAAPLARAVLRTKGVVLDSLLEDRVLAEASGDPEIRRQADELARLKVRLAQLRLNDLAPGDLSTEPTRLRKSDIDALAQQAEGLEAALARKVAGLGGSRRALSVSAAQVQAAIPGGAALIEFLRYSHYQGKGLRRDSYGALILSREHEPRWVRLGEADAIEKNLKLYQHLVRHGTDDGPLVALLGELHGQLWSPVAANLPGQTSRLIICPDAQLNFLSFATLLSSSNRFLAEDHDISYVASGRDLLAGNVAPTRAHDLLVWANPDFRAPSARSLLLANFVSAGSMDPTEALRGLDLHPLPGAEREGRWLQEHATDLGFAQGTLFLGGQATEAELARVQSPQVLHLATHGFLLPERSCASPSTVSFPTEPAGRRKSESINPMLRSGLALAGAKQTLDSWAEGEMAPPDNDGIVTAAEIGCLNLRRTQLVVLSACDSGMGEARAGEGVLGLRRGFIQAGAQNLLLTLWPIADEQTSGFMPEFYAAARQSGNPATALSMVQRSWLKKLRKEKGVAAACLIAGPFILSFQGRPEAGR